MRPSQRATGPESAERALQYVIAVEPEIALPEEQIDPVENDEPVIVAEAETEIETLTVGEAVMRMELRELSAMMFRNSVHGGLSTVYRRSDGNIGWIDPQNSPAAERCPRTIGL